MSLVSMLKSMGLRPKKGLGQNFLVDEEIAHRIVEVSKVLPEHRVVEIGPGVGSLTIPLLKKVKHLWVVEQDANLIPLLQQRVAGLGRLEIEWGDALAVNYRQLAERLCLPLNIVANLPYHISSPLLFHLLDQGDAISTMTLMFQKEVADRIAAPPNCKAYGILSVHAQLWMMVEKVLDVPPKSFYPQPKVDSCVIRLVRRPKPQALVRDSVFFGRVVKSAFGQRRKTLNNALKTLEPQPGPWLDRAGIDGRRRGETLSVVEFVHLANSAV